MTICIDIAIVTYNRSDLLERAIQSVLDQEDQGFTLYVLDNQSTDDTAALCERLLEPPHQYIRNPENYGMVGNWNEALKTGSAQYLNILHDDDELTPGFISSLKAFIARHPDCAFIHTAVDNIDQTGAVTGSKVHDFPEYVPGDAYFTGWLGGKVDVVCPTVVFNRDRLPSELRFSASQPFTADLVFFLKASAFGSVGYIRDRIFRYRSHDGSTTASLRQKLDAKIADRLSAGAEIQAEVDSRAISVDTPHRVGRRYTLRALAADILFTRLLGGGLNDVFFVAASVSRAEPELLRTLYFYHMFMSALIPPGLLRGAARTVRRLMGRGTSHRVDGQSG
jgi:glycosyltransferase involved in cell wall biosynthesis